jgi:hypothetical protein
MAGMNIEDRIAKLFDDWEDGKSSRRLVDVLADLVREAVAARLPPGMTDCVIVFHECEKGHGWLTAANWKQHGCLCCERDRAITEEREACAELVRNYIRHKLNTTDDGWTPYPDEKLIAKAIRARGLSVDEPLIVPAPASS